MTPGLQVVTALGPKARPPASTGPWLPCPQLRILTALTHKHKSLGPLPQGTHVPTAPRASVLRDAWARAVTLEGGRGAGWGAPASA